MPPDGYSPPHRDRAESDTVTFYVEDGTEVRTFAFSGIGDVQLRRAMVEVFREACGPDGSYRSIYSAEYMYQSVHRVLRQLATLSNPPRKPSELSIAHLAAVELHRPADYARIRTLIAQIPDISEVTRTHLRKSRRKPPPKTTQSLPVDLFRSVMAAARTDLMNARTRIRGQREVLDRWLAGPGVWDRSEKRRGELLEYVVIHGDVPRSAVNGRQMPWTESLGTVAENVSSLHLTVGELTAAAVLLVGLTGQNLAGISDLTIAHTRADGAAGGTKTAIVDVMKRRRGRRRRYMTVALSDVPDWVVGADAGRRSEDHLNTAFGVFKLLVELGEDSRRAMNTDRLLVGRAVSGVNGRHWLTGVNPKSGLQDWAETKGFVDDHGRATVAWRSLRTTFLQSHQKAVAHTPRVLVDEYLLGDRTNIEQYQKVVAGVLENQVTAARDRGLLVSLSEAEVELCRTAPAEAAAALGLPEETVKRLVSGALDTALAGCADVEHGPYDDGKRCTASFFLCLACPNARATPDHLPSQAWAQAKLMELRATMQPLVWAQRFGLVDTQLRQILERHPEAVVADALAAVSPDQRLVIDKLLRGGLDSL